MNLAALVLAMLVAAEPAPPVEALQRAAEAYEAAGNYAAAEPLYEKIVQQRKATLGVRHPEYAAALSGLATVRYLLGDYARAEAPLLEAVAITSRVLGPRHPEFSVQLNNLAALYHAKGDYARAVPLFEESQQLCRESFGENSVHYVRNLGNFAGLYCSMNDARRALPLADRAAAIAEALEGRESPLYATCLNNLAGIHYSAGDFGRAGALFERALEIRRKGLPPGHPDYATSLDNLAGALEALGQPDRALPLYEDALRIRQQTLGKRHPDYATSLSGLAGLKKSSGRLDEAARLYREALEVCRQAFGAHHPRYAMALNNLAAVCRAQGNLREATARYREAIQLTQALLDSVAPVLSERQHLAMIQSLRRTLDGYLAATAAEPAAGDPPEYACALSWKGECFARQRQDRLSAIRPELAPLLADLRSVSSRLAALALTPAEANLQAARARQIAELDRRKEQLETQLRQRAREYSQVRKAVSPGELRSALPADVALLDYLVYENSDQRESLRLLAFVVHPGRPILRLELGPLSPIAQDIETWREQCGRRAVETQAAQRLHDRLWRPLERHLDGVRIVIVSPDGPLARFPFAAMPGAKPDSYLIEDLGVATVPVPQLLPELLGSGGGRRASPSLLAIGDVDYDGLPGQMLAGMASLPVPRRAEGLHFASLSATRSELLTVGDSFDRSHPPLHYTALRAREATEAAFLRDAPGFRYLHLATHGFLLPAEPGLPPGLRAGFALAGANLPPLPGGDDGLVTADEIAGLPLARVELVVLSACETGLGQIANGEGVLGLQRAFQVAGAATVVGSLWKVEDDATGALMGRFYENLWQQKLGKLESLRQAQLAILGVPEKRGLELVDPMRDKPQRRKPFHWAPFVLSGDWR